MKSTKLALVALLLFGTLSACRQEPSPEPTAEAAAPVVEPAQAPDPIVPDPVVPEPAATPAPDTETPADATEEDDDTPHSGGDKVGN